MYDMHRITCMCMLVYMYSVLYEYMSASARVEVSNFQGEDCPGRTALQAPARAQAYASGIKMASPQPGPHPIRAEFDRLRADFDQTWPETEQVRAEVNQVWGDSARSPG